MIMSQNLEVRVNEICGYVHFWNAKFIQNVILILIHIFLNVKTPICPTKM